MRIQSLYPAATMLLFSLTSLLAYPAFGNNTSVNNGMNSGTPIFKHNFENTPSTPIQHAKTALIGWHKSGFGTLGAKVPLNGLEYDDLGDRGHVAYLNEGAKISQKVGVTLKENETYTITFDSGRPRAELGQYYIVRFTANGLALAHLQVTSRSTSPGKWKKQTLSFTATSDMPLGEPLEIEFQNIAATTGYQLHLDNITVTKSTASPKV